MRTLSKRQKKLLDQWVSENLTRLGIGFRVECCSFFSNELYEKLERMNDHETLTQNINRYVTDSVMSQVFRY